MMINKKMLSKKILEWFDEDVGQGDLSVLSTVPADENATGILYAKDQGIIAGLEVARMVFETWDRGLKFSTTMKDGDAVEKGTVIAEVAGSAGSILTAERLALNLLQRLSGIATMTNQYVKKAQQGNPQIRVVDTRKTTPGMRMLEKYAVRMGGGHNHRFGLFDAVMIKDNHIKAAGGIQQAVLSAKQYIPHTAKVEVEVETLDQLKQALEAKADIIMLDNMGPDVMREAVQMTNGQAILEASGGITLETIEEIAATGVDVISSGALTHSVKALDISLDLNQRKR